MTFSPREKHKLKQSVKVGESFPTVELSASVSSDIIKLSAPAEKVSFQADGTLEGTVEFSLDGVNWKHSTAIGATNTIVTFSTHLVTAIKISRTDGSGRLYLAVK